MTNLQLRQRDEVLLEALALRVRVLGQRQAADAFWSSHVANARRRLQQLVNAGMLSRAIVPAHTPFDGDLVFAAATGQRDLIAPPLQLAQICNAAAICLSRAIARAVWAATPSEDDLLPTLRADLNL